MAFGPKPRSYAYQVPKKVRRQALCSALSDQAREQKLWVIKDFNLPETKTKQLTTAMQKFGLNRALLIDRKDNAHLKLSARNLPAFCFRPVEGLNLVELLRYENLMISESSLKQLEGELKP